MKHLMYMILTGTALMCCSCEFTHNNRGYPPAVSFKKEGGVIELSGDRGMYDIIMYDGKTTVHSEYDVDNDSCFVHNDWLTIKWKYCEPRITLIALPNTRKKNRKVKIEGWYDPEYAEIEVSQKH